MPPFGSTRTRAGKTSHQIPPEPKPTQKKEQGKVLSLPRCREVRTLPQPALANAHSPSSVTPSPRPVCPQKLKIRHAHSHQVHLGEAGSPDRVNEVSFRPHPASANAISALSVTLLLKSVTTKEGSGNSLSMPPCTLPPKEKKETKLARVREVNSLPHHASARARNPSSVIPSPSPACTKSQKEARRQDSLFARKQGE